MITNNQNLTILDLTFFGFSLHNELMRIVSWIKKNKLATVLLIIVGYYFFGSLIKSFFGVSLLNMSAPSSQYGFASGYAGSASPNIPAAKGILLPSSYPIPSGDYAPQPDIENRLVIQESNLSLLVKDVVDTRDKILTHTNVNGGYMVSSSTSNPQDAPTATVIVRIPSEKLQTALDYFHSLSIKIVSENLTGRDVTDQYVDIEARIATHEKTKTKFENILEISTEISDITNLTQQIISTQNQIDSLKGQQDSLEKKAQMAKLTVYLSTDEIALPYAPSETFRPKVIFKLAVRSLVRFLRSLASFAIWVGVYSAVWIPGIAIFILVRKWVKRRKTQKPPENLPTT